MSRNTLARISGVTAVQIFNVEKALNATTTYTLMLLLDSLGLEMEIRESPETNLPKYWKERQG